MKLVDASIGCFVGSTLLFAACGVEPAAICDAPLACTAASDGGDGGRESGGDVAAPTDCDLSKALNESPACIDESVAVFVSPSGNDDASGKKDAPVKTIAKGLERAAASGLPRVYVCEGIYDAAAEIKAPVSLYGGLSCAWTVAVGTKPKLAPPKGVALRVTNVSGAVVIEDFEFLGTADPNTPGDSAIAVFVAESTNVTFRNGTLTAAAGTPGVKGASRSNYTGAMAANGGNANGALAGAGPSCTCVDVTSSKGGNGATGAGAGIQDGSAIPSVGGANAGSSSTTTCTDGQAGTNGAASAAGVAALSAGTLTSTGWDATTAPADAPNGHPGQGGGGGGSKTNVNSAGGGGACGGCGGAGGGSGTTGGSSFALLSFKSKATIEGGALATSAGGAGGAGGDGQSGQAGGALGAGAACNGALGGSGAGGSGAGGGAGGHSASIGFIGTEPKAAGATLTPGQRGSGGAGGTPGAGPGNPGAAGPAGPEGKSANTLAL